MYFSDKPFQLMRLKGKGRYYLTDKSGLPEPNLRELRRSQVEQRCPKVVEQGKLEILAFNHPHRIWGIGVGVYSFDEAPILPIDEWYQSEASLIKEEVPSPERYRLRARCLIYADHLSHLLESSIRRKYRSQTYGATVRELKGMNLLWEFPLNFVHSVLYHN